MKTLAIIGSYTPTRKLFDFTRADCDIWVFNEAVATDWCLRADAVFQMHDRVIWSNPANRNDPNHVLWLKNISATCNVCSGKAALPDGSKCPRCENGAYHPPANRLGTLVYMQDAVDEVPNSAKYPIDGIMSMIGNDPNHFLTSSVSQALALAAYLGTYTCVEIYGVAMTTNTEYQFQREGVAHWMGILRGMGIDVVFHGDTFEAPVYGFDGGVVIDYERFDERIAELKPVVDALSNQYTAGRVRVQKAALALEANGSKDVQNEVLATVQALLEINEQLGMTDGAIQENERYKMRADVMLKETGNKFVFARQEFESNAFAMKQRAEQADTEFISIATTLGHIERNAMQAAKGSPKRIKLFELYRQTIEQYFKAANRTAIFKGAAQENYNYMAYLDKRIRAAGGAKSEAVMLEVLANA